MATSQLEVDQFCDSPPTLLAIIRAARAIGDRSLERNARRELVERYGIELVFRREAEETARAS